MFSIFYLFIIIDNQLWFSWILTLLKAWGQKHTLKPVVFKLESSLEKNSVKKHFKNELIKMRLK